MIDVVPKSLAGMNELALNGTLEYQACDDRICFNPVSLPLSWKVSFGSFRRQKIEAPRLVTTECVR